ncbi:MAG: nucleoside kinase [Prevotellaceae bacterium]|jgi:uridine kinase|nr:nucleoside kinase [Prevotellaceae bacterium]
MNNIEILCENTGQRHFCPQGETLLGLIERCKVKLPHRILAALVDHQLKALSYAVYNPHTIRFVDISHPDGMRTYQRSLSFLLQKAVHDVAPHRTLLIKYSVLNGLYCAFNDNEVIDDALLREIEKRMRELVAADMPFTRKKCPTEEATNVFMRNNQPEKALLHKTLGHFYTSLYGLDGYYDHFYGPLAPSTSYVKVFALSMYKDGFVVRPPHPGRPDNVVPIKVQPKLFDVFRENNEWVKIVGAHTIGNINKLIQRRQVGEIITVSESLHENKYAQLAEEIFLRRHDVKLVLIAGPSSSGKTTTSKRLAIQAKVLGLNPVLLEMDNYFVDREHTPRDADGNYDFEAVEALDLPFFNEQLHDLLAGKKVQIPTFDFHEGKRFFVADKTLQVGANDILIMEGIHGLNPRVTQSVPDKLKYRIYVSALTSVSIDENNRISTTDNRLIRRMVRDFKFRGYSASDTIMRWPSVRRGEEKHIFPFQENADIMFNSALLYEMYVLRYYAMPLLLQIKPVDPAYTEASRLLKFLNYLEPISPENEKYICPTSVLREFIGNSIFD